MSVNRVNHEDHRIRELLAPLESIEPARRNVGRRSRRRLILALAMGVGVLAGAGAAIAAELGAFSETTAGERDACAPTTTALTTASGARVLTGQTGSGIYCLAYTDGNGTSVRTAGELGGTPAGNILALKALDTVSNEYVIAAVVPTGYDTLTVGSAKIPIQNHAFVVDPKIALAPGVLSGPTGNTSVNLAELAAP